MSKNGNRISIEFHRSLAVSLSVTLSLIGLSEDYEGFDPSIYSMYSALQPDLRQDIRALFKPFGNLLLFDGLLRNASAVDDLSAFISWIAWLSAEQVNASNLVGLRELARHASLDLPAIDAGMLEDREFTSALLSKTLVEFQHLTPHIDRIASLLANPEEMKANLIYIVTRFWDRHFMSEYAGWRTLEQRSLERGEQMDFTGDFDKDFREITGRDYPESTPPLQAIDHAVFVPSCFPGPYLSIAKLFGSERTIAVVYNCRPAGSTEHGTRMPIDEVFAPLKALADETRLEILELLAGRELYAQQIVDQMRVSQSAVSRHLRLMVACGILRERKHEGMKFYTIREDVISRLANHLSGIQGTGSSS